MNSEAQSAVHELAEKHHGLITRRQALTKGVKSTDIKRQVARGRWIPAGRGVYRLGGAPQTYEQSVMAATLNVPGALACLRSAARLYDLPIGDFEKVEIAVTTKRRPRKDDNVTIWLMDQIPSQDRSFPREIRATSVSRTILDLPAVLDDKLAAKVLDHALARHLVYLPFLAKRLAVLDPGGPGRKVAAALLAERQGLKSHPDSWYQARLHEIVRSLGLEGWTPEFEIRLPNGKVRRVDLAFVLLHLAVEVVSYLHHSQLLDWSADQARHNELFLEGWQVLYITTWDIESEPEKVGQQLLDAVSLLSKRLAPSA